LAKIKADIHTDSCGSSKEVAAYKMYVAEVGPKVTVQATLDIDVSAFTSSMSVDPSDTSIDFTALDATAAAEVQEFAGDVASSYASSVASTLGIDSSTVTVSCLYRLADDTKLDLITLSATCSAGRLLVAVYATDARRLATAGFGVQVDMTGSAVDTIEASGGSTAVASSLGSAEVVIQSDLIPGGSTTATTAEINVEVKNQAPTTSPTTTAPGSATAASSTPPPNPASSSTSRPEETTPSPEETTPAPVTELESLTGLAAIGLTLAVLA
jgi:hypothetical protein